MTPADLLTEIRSAISDETSVRWTDAELRTYMLDAELRIVRDHPESQYYVRVANSVPLLLANNTDAFTISPSWRNAVIHYVAFRVFSEDSEDAANAGLAKTHYALFEGGMK
jgi:hypothetical protein